MRSGISIVPVCVAAMDPPLATSKIPFMGRKCPTKRVRAPVQLVLAPPSTKKVMSPGFALAVRTARFTETRWWGRGWGLGPPDEEAYLSPLLFAGPLPLPPRLRVPPFPPPVPQFRSGQSARTCPSAPHSQHFRPSASSRAISTVRLAVSVAKRSSSVGPGAGLSGVELEAAARLT